MTYEQVTFKTKLTLIARDLEANRIKCKIEQTNNEIFAFCYKITENQKTTTKSINSIPNKSDNVSLLLKNRSGNQFFDLCCRLCHKNMLLRTNQQFQQKQHFFYFRNIKAK